MMYIQNPLMCFLLSCATLPYCCWSSYAVSSDVAENQSEISDQGGARLLRNPGRDAKRVHDLVRRSSFEQTDDQSVFKKTCASSALQEEEQGDVSVEELEDLNPFSDLSKNWLSHLRHLKRLERSSEVYKKLHVREYVAHKPELTLKLKLNDIDEDEAAENMTTWECLQAHGSNYGSLEPRMTCKFKNLYFDARGEGIFLAHVLKRDGTKTLPKIQVGTSDSYRDRQMHHIKIVPHNSVQDFIRTVLTRSPVKYFPGMSLAFFPAYHFNVGHGMWDGLYPAFVSLLQHGLDDKPFRPLIFGKRLDDLNKKCPQCYQNTENIYAVIGGMNTTTLADLIETSKEPNTYKFDELVVGAGPNSAKFDMNVNFTLGACRALDACRAFRKRVYKFAGVPLPVKVSDSAPYRVSVIHNKRFRTQWKPLQEFIQNESKKSLPDFSAKLVQWTPEHMQSLVVGYNGYNPQSVQLGDFREHLKIISQTDVFITGPGTSMMYQAFLPDGAVLINMGDDHFSYMEEYMTEGAPYLRGLYYPMRNESTKLQLYEETRMRSLLEQTYKLLKGGFTYPTPVSNNLSPMAKIYKAFSYWKYAKEPGVEMLAQEVPPHRLLGKPSLCTGNDFLGPEVYQKWSCHKDGEWAGILHQLAKAYKKTEQAKAYPGEFMDDWLAMPDHSPQSNSDLREFLELSGLA